MLVVALALALAFAFAYVSEKPFDWYEMGLVACLEGGEGRGTCRRDKRL